MRKTCINDPSYVPEANLNGTIHFLSTTANVTCLSPSKQLSTSWPPGICLQTPTVTGGGSSSDWRLRAGSLGLQGPTMALEYAYQLETTDQI